MADDDETHAGASPEHAGREDEERSDAERGVAGEAGAAVEIDAGDPQPLARVRYGLGKELRLYPDEFISRQSEVGDELRVRLEHVRRMIMLPGEYTRSKLVLMLELDDGTTLIAAEGMTNVRDFRRLLAALSETHPEIELDPPNMDEQLMQALEIKRRSLLGCYGFVFGSCILLWIVYIIVALIGHAHVTH
jgi:hypothetical protein